MEADFALFTGSTATRRALAACQNSKCKLECFRQRWLRCVCSSQLLLAPATGQEDVRSWQSCRSSWHWRRMIMTSDWLRASSATSAQAPLANRPAKLSRENHALRGLGPLDPRKSCSLSHSTGPRRRKNGSVSARGLSITLDQICVLTRPVL